MSSSRLLIASLLAGLTCAAAAAPAGAVTAEISGTTLLVRGGETPEEIHVGHRTGFDGAQSYSVAAFGPDGGERMVVVSGAGCAPSVFGVNNDDVGMAICAPQAVQSVVIEGLGGNDELEILTVAQPRYNKILVPVRLEGGAGADEINPDTGPTEANGGSGSDTIYRRCGPGAATLSGGSGNDAISACRPDTGDQAGGPVKIITGGPGLDILDGSGGRDRISGGAGQDTISGFAGADRVDAGAGPDLVLGGGGDDRLLGRAGNDGLMDFEGDNVMIGAGGRDAFSAISNDGSAATGSSRLSGGAGGDSFLIRNGRRDRASGGPGRDLAQVNSSDVLRSIEDIVRRTPRFPGL